MKCQGVGHSNVTGAQSGTAGICDINETELLATIYNNTLVKES